MSRQSHPFQMGLHGFNGSLWLPNAAGDGKAGLGPDWAIGAASVVSQPTPTTTDLGSILRRTRFGTAGVGNNQEIGIRQSNAADFRYWISTTDGLGGFYFSAMFRIETWINTGRLFVGLASSAAGAVVTSDTPANPCVGLWHKTTHAANELYLMNHDGTTFTESKVTETVANPSGSPYATKAIVFGANTTWRFEMWSETAASLTNCRLTSLNAATPTYVFWQQLFPSTALKSALMAPQVQVSNGTTVALDNIAIAPANVYISSEPTLT